jgi:hypothetical protein
MFFRLNYEVKSASRPVYSDGKMLRRKILTAKACRNCRRQPPHCPMRGRPGPLSGRKGVDRGLRCEEPALPH